MALAPMSVQLKHAVLLASSGRKEAAPESAQSSLQAALKKLVQDYNAANGHSPEGDAAMHEDAAAEEAESKSTPDPSSGTGSLHSQYRDLLVLYATQPVSLLWAATLFQQCGITGDAPAGTLLLDQLWTVCLELEAAHARKASQGGSAEGGDAQKAIPADFSMTDEWRRLASLTGTLINRGVLSRAAAVESLELEFLEAAQIIKAEVKQRVIKTNTRLHYTQAKFNLFAEESEGYAKLCELLLGPLPTGTHASVREAIARQVLGLSGRFSLDPNRVWDVVLDAVDVRMRTGSGAVIPLSLRSPSAVPSVEPILLSLLDGRLFSRDNLAHVLAFKFSQYQQRPALPEPAAEPASSSAQPPVPSQAAASAGTGVGAGAAGDKAAPTAESSLKPAPESLYLLAAVAITHGFVSMRQVWPCLGPDAVTAKTIAEQLQAALKEAARTIPAAAALNPAPPATIIPPAAQAPGGAAISAPAGAGTVLVAQGNTVTASCGTAEPWTHPVAPLGIAAEKGHQKVGLVAALVRIGSWSFACQAMSMLQDECHTGQAFATYADRLLPVEDALHSGQDLTWVPAPTGTMASAALLSVLRPRASGSSALDMCIFPSVAKAACALLQGLLQPTAEAGSVRKKMLDAVGAPAGQVYVPPCSIDLARGLPIYARAQAVVDRAARPGNSCVDMGEESGVSDQATRCVLAAPTSMHSLPAGIRPLLEFLGPHLSCSVSAVTTLLRLGRDLQLSAQQVEAGKEQKEAGELMNELLRTCVLPSLGLCGSAPFAANVAWEYIRTLPWPQRYALYTSLKDSAPDSHPLLAFAKNKAYAVVKSSMKRISLETLRAAGRALAKTASSHPLVVGDMLCSQLEGYDNLIPLAVEACKFLSPLAIDTVAFSIIDRIAGPGPVGGGDRTRTHAEGVGPVQWLSNISTFAGSFFRRFFSLELGGVLHAVISALTGNGGSSDAESMLANAPVLHFLSELIQKMAGLEIPPELTVEQLDACGGSETLRAQYLSRTLLIGPPPWTAGTSAARTAPKLADANARLAEMLQTKRAALRLRDALLGSGAAATGAASAPIPPSMGAVLSSQLVAGTFSSRSIALPLYVLIAQMEDVSLFGAPKGALHTPDGFDLNDQDALAGFNYDWDAATAPGATPPLRLVSRRFDSVHTALMLYSDLLRLHVLPLSTSYAHMLPPLHVLWTDLHLSSGAVWQLVRPAVRTASYPTLVDGVADPNAGPVAGAGATTVASAAELQQWSLYGSSDGTAGPLIAALQAQPELSAAWTALTPSLYAMFYGHSLYDLACPTGAYDKAASALKDAVAALDAAYGTGADMRTLLDKERIRTRYLDVMKRLRSEAPAQSSHVKRVSQHFEAAKDSLFAKEAHFKDQFSALLQHAVLPRCLVSPEEALYCSRFLMMLHTTGVRTFNLPAALGLSLSHACAFIGAATENEAACLGVLIADILTVVLRWKDNAQLYTAECGRKSSFSLHYEASDGDSSTTAQYLTHEQYCAIAGKLVDDTGRALRAALSSGEHSQAKNSIVVLRRLNELSLYPRERPSAQAILALTSLLKSKDDMPDLKMLAFAFHGALEKKWAGTSTTQSSSATAAASSRTGAGAAGILGSSVAGSKLTANAAPYVPARAGPSVQPSRSTATTSGASAAEASLARAAVAAVAAARLKPAQPPAAASTQKEHGEMDEELAVPIGVVSARDGPSTGPARPPARSDEWDNWPAGGAGKRPRPSPGATMPEEGQVVTGSSSSRDYREGGAREYGRDREHTPVSDKHGPPPAGIAAGRDRYGSADAGGRWPRGEDIRRSGPPPSTHARDTTGAAGGPLLRAPVGLPAPPAAATAGQGGQGGPFMSGRDRSNTYDEDARPRGGGGLLGAPTASGGGGGGSAGGAPGGLLGAAPSAMPPIGTTGTSANGAGYKRGRDVEEDRSGRRGPPAPSPTGQGSSSARALLSEPGPLLPVGSSALLGPGGTARDRASSSTTAADVRDVRDMKGGDRDRDRGGKVVGGAGGGGGGGYRDSPPEGVANGGGHYGGSTQPDHKRRREEERGDQDSKDRHGGGPLLSQPASGAPAPSSSKGAGSGVVQQVTHSGITVIKRGRGAAQASDTEGSAGQDRDRGRERDRGGESGIRDVRDVRDVRERASAGAGAGGAGGSGSGGAKQGGGGAGASSANAGRNDRGADSDRAGRDGSSQAHRDVRDVREGGTRDDGRDGGEDRRNSSGKGKSGRHRR